MNEIVSSQGEDEDGIHARSASPLDLGQPARGLDPAEHFLDALAAALADVVADVTRHAAIDRRLTGLAGLARMAVDCDGGLTERDRNEATKAATS